MSHHRWERIALAALLMVALGSACSSDGNGSGQGAVTNTGAVSGRGGQSANASGSGNLGGQAGGSAQGGNGQPGGGTANGSGATGNAGTTANGGGGGSSGGAVAGAAGTAASSGGAPSGGATTLPDGGTCCKTADCQPADVKTCVCTQWQQSQCCSAAAGAGWDTFCQTTAEEKCNAEKCLTTTEPPPVPTPDGGEIIKGACCATHSTPGCADKATEQCICALLGDCCTKQWDSVCVQLVREKHCEAGVRDCVCTTWQQQSCCDTDWTMACSLVATSKCGAQPACP